MDLTRLCRLFSRSSKSHHAVPAGVRVYAVGDVHGSLEPLNKLLDAIEGDCASADVQSHLIFLGDLVDRGRHSAQVIDRLLTGGLPTDRWDCIMGNHEEVMLECYGGRLETVDGWLGYGGVETLESYGLRSEAIFGSGFDFAAAMRRAIPAHHIRFLKSMKDYVRLGDYLFVHAGIRPGIPVEAQAGQDLRWIRKGFVDDRTDHGMMVVHGHTIVPEVEFRANRIAVDTGCYRTGRLSALVLEAATTRVLAVGP